MQLKKLDHVNVRTSNLEQMIEWYTDILGMRNGERPPFPFPGAWMYAGDQAVVHLVVVDQEPVTSGLKLEHFALSATGLAAFIERLTQRGIEYQCARVPEFDVFQVNVYDCDGNHIHIDFSTAEADAINL
ncbi:MAG: VOC family protein [Stappiaceae bacterium]